MPSNSKNTQNTKEWNYMVPSGMGFGDDYDEPVAVSSPPRRPSSPPDVGSPTPGWKEIFLDPNAELLPEDAEDPEYTYKGKRAEAFSQDAKVLRTLNYMKTFSRFSLYDFISGLFKSEDPDLKASAGMFYAELSHIDMMDAWWKARGGLTDPDLVEWVTTRAAEICAREASFLTDRASAGPFFQEAESLRIPAASVTVKTVEEFENRKLLALYERVTPRLQQVLRSVVSPPVGCENEKERDLGRTMVTSMVLNLRSQKTNYHQAVNTLVLWDNRVPKRLIQMLNQYSFCSSYSYQINAVDSVSKDSVNRACAAANDPNVNPMLPYDNTNWKSHAWESSALHGTRNHDQVSAILIELPTPEGTTAKEVSSIQQFKDKQGSRHKISAYQALHEILPNAEDLSAFRQDAIIQVQNDLVDCLSSLEGLRSTIPRPSEAKPIPATKTKEHYLPTLDQEQGSTRGNMKVLEYYFTDLLKMPKKYFEDKMVTVLGDRLTVARDRAAQDQRAVDTSPHAFDHFSSFSMVGGLMHYEMNFMAAVLGNSWGSEGNSDAISLSTLLKLLPNRAEVNPRKVNYYTVMRFLEVAFKALVLKAAFSATGASSIDDLTKHIQERPQSLSTIATAVVDKFVLPSRETLEQDGVKTLQGETESWHAVLLLHNIATIRIMHDAIKRGHPTRVLRIVKFWMPMFYAAGSYNYANECMELLHNMRHDWPSPYKDMAFNGMFFNPRGRIEDNKPTDIRVEHLNDGVKERAHGTNATPELLAKVVPAMGHLQNLTDRVFDEMGVEKNNQRHAHVKQKIDVDIILRHLVAHKIFDFAHDKPSPHSVVDLYRYGLRRVSGLNGGHRRHLARHKLRLRERHSTEDVPIVQNEGSDLESVVNSETVGVQFTLGQRDGDGDMWDDIAEELGADVDRNEMY